MSDWELAGEVFTTSDLQSSIRMRDSAGSKALVQQLLKEKSEGASHSVALTAIDNLKKSHKYKLKRHPNYAHVPDSLFEESYNDSLLKIYDRISQFDGTKASLNTWIDKIIDWTFLSNYRTWQADKQNSTSPSIDDEANDPWLGLFEAVGEGIETSNWQEDILVTAFKNLSERDRNLLRYLAGGLTPTQMVEEGYLTGVSVNAVTVALHEARKRFKKQLAAVGWEIKKRGEPIGPPL